MSYQWPIGTYLSAIWGHKIYNQTPKLPSLKASDPSSAPGETERQYAYKHPEAISLFLSAYVPLVKLPWILRLRVWTDLESSQYSCYWCLDTKWYIERKWLGWKKCHSREMVSHQSWRRGQQIDGLDSFLPFEFGNTLQWKSLCSSIYRSSFINSQVQTPM